MSTAFSADLTAPPVIPSLSYIQCCMDGGDDDAPEHRAHVPALAGVGVNAPLVVAGSLAVLAAAVHGVGGEVLVVRKLSPGTLPGSRFGGPSMTKAMIHVTWHMTTIAFFAVGAALIASGSFLHGDTARGIAVVAAGASTGFAALAVGLGGATTQFPRSLLRHPAPIGLTVTAALAWLGAL
jgi:hypothetical protein